MMAPTTPAAASLARFVVLGAPPVAVGDGASRWKWHRGGTRTGKRHLPLSQRLHFVLKHRAPLCENLHVAIVAPKCFHMLLRHRLQLLRCSARQFLDLAAGLRRVGTLRDTGTDQHGKLPRRGQPRVLVQTAMDLGQLLLAHLDREFNVLPCSALGAAIGSRSVLVALLSACDVEKALRSGDPISM